ncbi:ankyrin repeat domain-containing protein [Candidatus Odyssella acanthamoebae]|uniref:F-box domain-containing protein n=1 Tax=Candidatus Odyssella acanthamoebae TaxID=91604 RepID=A0A077ATN8_9PROT|nr:ankyrin repeat domain-containing protein [Candidatus Paracaedibacter acanthamoebae]AIK96542.1 hypothetical protein ID47_07000 [Candidatus Paracaedibacter acanthamoebae]
MTHGLKKKQVIRRLSLSTWIKKITGSLMINVIFLEALIPAGQAMEKEEDCVESLYTPQFPSSPTPRPAQRRSQVETERENDADHRSSRPEVSPAFEGLEADPEREALKNRIISQLFQPAFYQRTKIKLYHYWLEATLSPPQQQQLQTLINLMTAPEGKLRVGRDFSLREDFRASPRLNHELFKPLKVHLAELENYKPLFRGTPVERWLQKLIESHHQFMQTLVDKVKDLGLHSPLSLFEVKPLLIGEDFKCYEVETDKAYKFASYDPTEFDYERKNSSGLSIGGEQGGVYFKVDNDSGLLRPAKERAVYQFYQRVMGTGVSPTHLLILNCLPILPPDMGSSPERKELLEIKKQHGISSTQEVFKRFPRLEQRFHLAQQERPLFLQGSLYMSGKTLEEFLEEAEKSSDPVAYINQLDKESFSRHVLCSLLLIPTDYKADNLIVDETYRIIGIDNDQALESLELKKKKNSGRHEVRAKNILYTLPLMMDSIAEPVRKKIQQPMPGLLLLNWLVDLKGHENRDVFFIEAGLLNTSDLARLKEQAQDSLELPLKFVPGWMSQMHQRFMRMQQLLSNPSLTHQELFNHLHPFASRYYASLSRKHPLPLDRIASLYQTWGPEWDFETLIEEDPHASDDELLQTLESKSFLEQPATLTLEQTMKELIATTNLHDYSFAQQLEWLERIADIGVWPDQLHSSWDDRQLLFNMVREGASDKAIRVLVEKTNADINAQDEEGGTALHHAVTHGQKSKVLEQIDALFNLGAYLEIQDKSQETPLDKAVKSKDHSLIIKLVSLGAGKKARASSLQRYTQTLTPHPKQDMAKTLETLEARNPKYGWKMTLDTVFPCSSSEASWGVLNTVSEGKRIVLESAYRQLFDERGNPCKSNQHGKRCVPKVEIQGRSLYVKFAPEGSGTELSVGRLIRSLIDEGNAPYVEMAELMGHPVLLIQAVSGETLWDMLHPKEDRINPPTPKEIFKKLDSESVSAAIIMAMLINPGDGSPANYILSPFLNSEGELRYRITSIDHDHSFVPAIAEEIKDGWFGTKIFTKFSLQVQTILYCLNQMKDPIHPNVIRKFIHIDPFDIIKPWLISLDHHNKSINALFSRREIRALTQGRDTVIGTSFAPGMIRTLYTKMVRMQKALNPQQEGKSLTHFDLLELLEEPLSARYKAVLANSTLTPEERFELTDGDNYEKDTKNNTIVSSATLARLLESCHIPQKEVLQKHLLEGRYGPMDALKELETIQHEHTLFTAILQSASSIHPDFFRKLQTEGIQESLLRQLDLKELSFPQQQALVDALRTKILRTIKLAYCRALSIKALQTLSLTHVRYLDLSYCSQLSGFSTNATLTREQLHAPFLKTLTLQGCKALKDIRLNAPLLRTLEAAECPLLEILRLTAPKLKYADFFGDKRLKTLEIKPLNDQTLYLTVRLPAYKTYTTFPSFTALPNELLLHIFSFVNKADLAKFMLLNKFFREFLIDHYEAFFLPERIKVFMIGYYGDQRRKLMPVLAQGRRIGNVGRGGRGGFLIGPTPFLYKNKKIIMEIWGAPEKLDILTVSSHLKNTSLILFDYCEDKYNAELNNYILNILTEHGRSIKSENIRKNIPILLLNYSNTNSENEIKIQKFKQDLGIKDCLQYSGDRDEVLNWICKNAIKIPSRLRFQS